MNSFIVSIEGNIGSGKSTFINYLKRNLTTIEGRRVVYIDEPVDTWNSVCDKDGDTILVKFYKDKKENAFPFQMMAYITRLAKTREAIRNNPGCVFITERCLNTDRYIFAKMLYDMGDIREIDYNIYLKWFDEFYSEIQTSCYIYVKTDPDKCHSRVNIRKRDGEEGISLEYLQSCHQYHEEWLNDIDNKIVLDGNLHNKNLELYSMFKGNVINNVKKVLP